MNMPDKLWKELEAHSQDSREVDWPAEFKHGAQWMWERLAPAVEALEFYADWGAWGEYGGKYPRGKFVDDQCFNLKHGLKARNTLRKIK